MKKWNIKEYDKNGNIINELINGKGYMNEYNNNNNNIKIFEGEYINGLPNGKGKEYYVNGNLKFEGEYLNGYKNGKGKLYFESGDLSFEVEFLYNQPMKGKCYINKRLEYEGEFLYIRKYNGKGYDEQGNIIYELINGTGKVKEYLYDND